MKKLFYSAAIAALALTACAKVETIDVNQGDPLSFGVYIPNSVTKGGIAGDLTSATIKDKNYGVFAYYTGAAVYNADKAANYMYNQKVTYNTTADAWEYSPIKYWPNMTNGDNKGSSDDNTPKVSFLAYAPYARVTPSSGVVNPDTGETAATIGITGVIANNVTGDAWVTYAIPASTDNPETTPKLTPATSVDLTYAVSGGMNYTDVANNSVVIAEDAQILDMTKPNTAQKINFKFKHALTKLDVYLQVSRDQEGFGTAWDNTKDATKVTVESIKITVDDMATSGKLNLRTGEWSEPSGTGNDKIIYIAGDDLNPTIKDKGSEVKYASQPTGVTIDSKISAFNSHYVDPEDPSAGSAPGTITLIPQTSPYQTKAVTVEIKYYVITNDSNLADGESRIYNHITKSVDFPCNGSTTKAFMQGTINTLNIGLGLTSVKLQATVADWDTGQTINIFLPENEN